MTYGTGTVTYDTKDGNFFDGDPCAYCNSKKDGEPCWCILGSQIIY